MSLWGTDYSTDLRTLKEDVRRIDEGKGMKWSEGIHWNENNASLAIRCPRCRRHHHLLLTLRREMSCCEHCGAAFAPIPHWFVFLVKRISRESRLLQNLYESIDR